MPSYLQISLDTLTKEQERFRKQFAGAFTPAGAFEAYQEQARKNLAMFEQAMSMFSPFVVPKPGQKKPDEADAGKDEPGKPSPAKHEAAKPHESVAPVARAVTFPEPKTKPAEPATAIDVAELKAQLAAMQAKIEKLSPGKG